MIEVRTNITGTMSNAFRIGIGGPTIFQGTASPPSEGLGQLGDMYIQHGTTETIYMLTGNGWALVSDQTLGFTSQRSPAGSVFTINRDVDYVGISVGIVVTVDSTIITADDETITADRGFFPDTQVTLMTGIEGYGVMIKDESAHAADYPIVINADGENTIDGAATYVLNRNFGSVLLLYAGSAWRVLNAS